MLKCNYITYSCLCYCAARFLGLKVNNIKIFSVLKLTKRQTKFYIEERVNLFMVQLNPVATILTNITGNQIKDLTSAHFS